MVDLAHGNDACVKQSPLEGGARNACMRTHRESHESHVAISFGHPGALFIGFLINKLWCVSNVEGRRTAGILK